MPLSPSPRLFAAARAAADLSQEALADIAGVSVNTLRMLERGTTNPTTRIVKKLEAALATHGVAFVLDPDGVFEYVRRRLSPPAAEPVKARRDR